MATVTFLEKTGCAGNARQKALLVAAGHEVLARDLRQVNWSNRLLLDFLAGLPVAAWFNRSAAAVKSGAIVPEELDETTALALLRDNPLLIRRPLLQVGEQRMAGFDAARVHAWLGLAEVPADDLEACQRKAAKPRVFYAHTASGCAFRCEFPARAADDPGCPDA